MTARFNGLNKELLKDIIPAIAKKYKFRPIIVEKDFYMTIILNSIESHFSNKLIFKGGSLLNKIYFDYQKLSEDLDFTLLIKDELNSRSKRSKAIAPIRENMRSFLSYLDLTSNNPEGEGFNNSTQYIFNILFSSFISGKNENLKLEISLSQFPIDKPVYNVIKHFYKNPFTNEDLIPENKILSLSLTEAVAEKLKAAITRKDLAIRDYYDLWHIVKSGFDFYNKKFLNIFKKKLEGEGYKGDYSYNFGLGKVEIELLYQQVKTDLIPVIRIGEHFNLKKVLERFNKILKEVNYS
ncbi:MAG: nucleotidyl transferase AbiEii/AbiGii toxin family protein [Candidatus Cloacimonetes bacterium]|nr:nucleotidyl transferase AbiEii/AbiGii toxin family protein [Candidatus Cloacimonadota bacterium]